MVEGIVSPDAQPILKVAAKAAHEVITEYCKEAVSSHHLFVAIIYDPRYKLLALEFLFNFNAQGGKTPTGLTKVAY
jgi:hypothetical protein